MLGPNLIVIGAMKAGTSSLHQELARHADIWMSPFKEPAFFLGPVERSAPSKESDKYRNDVDRYLSLFADGQTKAIRGESTTGYTMRPLFEGVPKRIYGCAPTARLIYLLRDPIERTISHYWWNVHHEGERREMLTAIAEDSLYRDFSYYAWQLEAYLEYFASDQILVETTEDLETCPQQVLTRIFSWLGLSTQAALGGQRRRDNTTPSTLIQTRSSMLQNLRHSRFGNVLTRVVPAPLRAIGRHLAERQVDRLAMPTQAVRDFLAPVQRQQTEHLSDLLGRRFPQWTSLHGVARTA